MSENPEIRIGSAERESAVEALRAHFEAGRLDADEYEDRRGRAGDATTRGELAALFADLPSLQKGSAALGVPAEGGSAGDVVPVSSGRRKQVADIVMGVVPIAALALFFLTDSWLWFLAIPFAAVVFAQARSGD